MKHKCKNDSSWHANAVKRSQVCIRCILLPSTSPSYSCSDPKKNLRISWLAVHIHIMSVFLTDTTTLVKKGYLSYLKEHLEYHPWMMWLQARAWSWQHSPPPHLSCWKCCPTSSVGWAECWQWSKPGWMKVLNQFSLKTWQHLADLLRAHLIHVYCTPMPKEINQLWGSQQRQPTQNVRYNNFISCEFRIVQFSGRNKSIKWPTLLPHWPQRVSCRLTLLYSDCVKQNKKGDQH